ncbi:MAG: carboxy terminal-processing peptidase [Saprospiraceae bacterium]|nr:carboxy terminal-processing peptidase [Saprospiraceae bacterium]
MKLKGTLFFSAAALALVTAAYLPSIKTTNPEKEGVILQTILGGLNQLHYKPIELNDEFSNKVYDLYLERLDRSKRFLTQGDIALLKKYRNDLDDEAKRSTFEYFDIAQELYNKSLDKTQKYYQDILAEPFDLTINEAIELDGKKRDYASNDVELKNYWRQLLQNDALNRLSDKLEEQEKGNEKFKDKTLKDLEQEVRADILKSYNDWYTRLRKEKRNERLADYLNTITNIFDPHTGYFDPIEKQNFDMQMSGRLEGIGAKLQSEGDYTKVSEIVPGGPAWKQGELKANDIILKVAQGANEPVDISGMSTNEVVSMIRGKKGTEVRLTVRNVDGTTQTVKIVRDEVIMDEGYVKSSVLDLPGTIEKIGYIKLPRFYADFEKEDGRSCATDVATEIEKLKKTGVNGIILDLRNNGGGSLRDVVTMSGYFIEKGPIVQVNSRIGEPELHQDLDAKVQYGGPLIVMINEFSASASEILAAALQDYGRAVIVGTKSYGKGTVQRFFDLDRAVRGNENMKPLGEIKLTIQKFYRIDGGSTQLKGVTPDIILPDEYEFLEIGERELEFAMPWTEIKSVPHKQNVYYIKDMNKLKAQSEKRLSNSEAFKLIEENAKYFKAKKDDTQYTLNLKKYQEEQKQLQAKSKKFEDMFKENPSLKVENLQDDVTFIQADSSRIARNEDFIKNIKKDVYLEETLHIMQDLINQSGLGNVAKNN